MNVDKIIESDIFFLTIMVLLFLILIIGTKFKWKILVDPPEEWIFYSHSKLKKYFGSEFLIIFNYVVGILGGLVSIIMLFEYL